MDKKKKTYLLLVLVIIVWGLIGYRIFSYLNPPEDRFSPAVTKDYTINTRTPSKKDTFEITNYRDPFLGKIVQNKKKEYKPNVLKMQFPQVLYHGLVKNKKHRSYIMSVGRQQEIVKIGDQFLGVKLVSATSHQITVLYKKVTKVIKLQD